jgi:hypothetical protein
VSVILLSIQLELKQCSPGLNSTDQDKIITPSYETSSSSPTATTSNTVKASISSTCSTQQNMSTGNLPKVNTPEVINRDMEK